MIQKSVFSETDLQALQIFFFFFFEALSDFYPRLKEIFFAFFPGTVRTLSNAEEYLDDEDSD